MPITNKVYEYQTFVEWIATPGTLRRPSTQKALAKQLNIDASTLSDWKKEEAFWIQVDSQLRLWSRNRTPDVIEALYQNVKATGNPSAVKLWLEMFGADLSKNIQRDAVTAMLDELGPMTKGPIIFDKETGLVSEGEIVEASTQIEVAVSKAAAETIESQLPSS